MKAKIRSLPQGYGEPLKLFGIYSFFGAFLLIFVANSQVSCSEEKSFKPLLRSIVGGLSHALAKRESLFFPEGMKKVEFPGCIGIRIDPDKFIIRTDFWKEPIGLLERTKSVIKERPSLVAAINGTFFCDTGILGQALCHKSIPTSVTQISGKLSRCFVATLQGKNGIRWVLGETEFKASKLQSLSSFQKVNLNRRPTQDERFESLLGGGGWVVRDSKDAHMEAYVRQRFRFRKVDQDSRHTIFAMDSSNRLYALVFEAGANLEKISSLLRTRKEFQGITDAIFLDGGSSSTLVLNNEYLVPPMYFIDKARFSAILIEKKQ